MSQGLDYQGNLSTWPVTENALKIALGLDYSLDDVRQAWHYYEAYFDTVDAHLAPDGTYGFADGSAGVPDPNVPSGRFINDGALEVLPAGGMESLADWEFEIAVADGVGGEFAEQAMVLRNGGNRPLTVYDVAIEGEGSDYFHVSSATLAGTVLQPNDSIPFQLTFDPAEGGRQTAELVVRNDGVGEVYRVALGGYGQSSTGDLSVDIPNNNLGGAGVGDFPVRVLGSSHPHESGSQSARNLLSRHDSGRE